MNTNDGDNRLPPRRISVAPMMGLTTRHARYFLRLLTRHTWLYTEMVTAQALLRGDAERQLRHHPDERPLALQIGGCEPSALARCAALGEAHGYNEINLNIGCPSDRVKSGRFGACLMAEPEAVAASVRSMRAACDIPVTVKTRIGIDHMDDYNDLARFIDAVAAAGCSTFIIHARKAWLQGLSPRENREIPPLRYSTVYRVKREFPGLEIIINGGIDSWARADTHLQHVDGIMLGRAAYHNPYLLTEADSRSTGSNQPPRTRGQVAEALIPYVRAELADGTRLHHITRHILGLFQGQPGARRWRRYLSRYGCAPHADESTILSALAAVADAHETRAVA